MAQVNYNYKTPLGNVEYGRTVPQASPADASTGQFSALVAQEVAASPEVTSDFEMDAAAADAGSDFFGADGLTFGDVIDAINPLNHIPFISGLFSDGKEQEVSVASKLVGGALLGGPLGLVAGLANVIFEQATGKGVAETMVAALVGQEPAIQAASNETASEQEIAAIQSADIPPPQQARAESVKPFEVASAAPTYVRPVHTLAPAADSREQMLLDLYGGSAQSAHRSYKNAQMRDYLNDVTRSQVI